MDETTQVETEVVPTATPEETPVPSQDPIQTELDRIEGNKRTKKEKLEFTLKRVQEQLAEFGEVPGEDDLDRPMTLRDYEARKAIDAHDTAISLIDGLDEDDKVKELAKYHLENTIRPSGDSQTDLRLALSLVNGVKNRQLAEEASRKTAPRTASSAPSAPPRETAAEPELTPDEQKLVKAFGMTKEGVIKSRQG